MSKYDLNVINCICVSAVKSGLCYNAIFLGQNKQ